MCIYIVISHHYLFIYLSNLIVNIYDYYWTTREGIFFILSHILLAQQLPVVIPRKILKGFGLTTTRIKKISNIHYILELYIYIFYIQKKKEGSFKNQNRFL